jgi:hypothetical protein
LSSFLFDFVTDALCQILIRDNEAGLLHVLGPILANDNKVMNFYYANDIIFFFKQIQSVLKQCFGHLKYLRLCQK